MRNNTLLFILILLLMINKCAWSVALTSDISTRTEQHDVYINNSSYSIDTQLINNGYSIQNVNNELTLFYKNNRISAEAFYGSSIGRNEAIKLYILLKETMENASIYLNDNLLDVKTDNVGIAKIDKYFKSGNFHLMLLSQDKKHSLNYYFLLDGDIRLICSGIRTLNCRKEHY